MKKYCEECGRDVDTIIINKKEADFNSASFLE